MGWVKKKPDFANMFHLLRILPIGVLLLVIGCTKSEVEPCDDQTPLHSLASYPIGVAVSPAELEYNTSYREIVLAQFNRFTPGNALKPDALHPVFNAFSFYEADSLIALAEQQDKLVHGHTLIWHNQIPGWMQGFKGSKQEWIEMMKLHIQTVVAHFGDKVPSWDVVNEAFEENGSFRESIWFQNIGQDYIKLAFQFAHEANPDALLFYNDFNVAQRSRKCKAIAAHLSELKEEGVPVHGMGMQLHIFNSIPSENAIRTAVDAFVEKGFLVHFSEVDISMNLNGDMKLSHGKLQKQGNRMKALVDIFQEIPPAQQFGITVWGVSDRDSWIPSFFGREDYPLLYDGDYVPKPMYCGFKQGLTNW